MAEFSLHVGHISRSNGAKVVHAMAYYRGAKMYDARSGQYSKDFSYKQEVIHSEILMPHDAPEWVQQLVKSQAHDIHGASEFLWNKVEDFEKRKDSQVATTVMLAVPKELNAEDGKNLVREYLQDTFCSLGMIADYSIHWEGHNPHAHVALTQRHLTTDGFGLKNRDWNDKKLVTGWREQWARYQNRYLGKRGFESRVDHRSYAERGIDLVPTIHRGRSEHMNAKGVETRKMAEYEHIKAENTKRVTANPETILTKVSQDMTSFSFEDIANECIKQVPVNDILEQNSPVSAKRSSSIGQQIIRSVLKTNVVFSERDLARQMNMSNIDAKDFVQVLLSIKGSKELIYLGVGSDGRDRYTTKSCFKTETQMIEKVEKLATSIKYFIESDQVDNAIERFENEKGFKLSHAQKQAISHLTSGADVSCLVGQAGTGKTTVLTPAARAWKGQGYKTIGVALANVAANNLKECNFDKTMSVFSLIEQIEKHNKELLDDKTVLVIDEFSMVGSEDAAKLVELCDKYKSKMVMVGDYGQLYGVKGGAPMKAIKELIGSALLDDIIRQQVSYQRQASQSFAIGNIEEGLQAYYEKGNIHFVENDISTKEALINSWIKDDTSLAKKIIMAHENKDVADLNIRARKALLEDGVLENSSQLNMRVARGYIKKKVYAKNIELAVNERIAFKQGGYIADIKMKLANNQMATITNIKNGVSGGIKSLSLRLDGEDQDITLKAKDIREQNLELVHSYAATVHKLQGCTLNKAWAYASTMWDRALLYVAMTRHKMDVQLYVSQEKFKDLKDLVRQCSRKAVKDSVLDFPLKFSMNRGMEVDNLTGIKFAFADKIITKSKEVRDFIELKLNPEKYYAQKQLEETLKRNKEEAVYRQREAQQKSDNAIVVGKYLDANQACGKAWSEVEAYAKENTEYWDIENNRADLVKMRDLSIYRDAKLATNHANDLANIIVKNVDRYKEILRDNGIDIEILEIQTTRVKIV
jgi:Ti-type conjugative transfer relaxase TraA